MTICASCLREVDSADGQTCEQCERFFGSCCSFHLAACDADTQQDVYYSELGNYTRTARQKTQNKIDRPDIAEAVQDCVDYAFDDDQPVEKIAEFIFILKGSGWSDTDLNLVKTTVLAELETQRSGA